MTVSTWEYRPGPQSIKYTDLVGHLKVNPGVWVKVRTASSDNAAWSAAHQIKTGRRAAFRPAGHFEAYTEGCDIIARYVGAEASR
jgi:hypothetical protein